MTNKKLLSKHRSPLRCRNEEKKETKKNSPIDMERDNRTRRELPRKASRSPTKLFYFDKKLVCSMDHFPPVLLTHPSHNRFSSLDEWFIVFPSFHHPLHYPHEKEKKKKNTWPKKIHDHSQIFEIKKKSFKFKKVIFLLKFPPSNLLEIVRFCSHKSKNWWIKKNFLKRLPQFRVHQTQAIFVSVM